MGSDPAADKLVFGDKYGPGEIARCGLSTDGKWLLCQVSFGHPATRPKFSCRISPPENRWFPLSQV